MITNKTFIKYRPLVYKILNKLKKNTFSYKTYIDWDEVEQVGQFALWKAVLNYKQESGKFLTYAYKSITNDILRHLNKESRIELHNELSTIKELEYQDDLDISIEAENIYNKITEYINKLPILDKHKQVLLYRSQGDSIKDIAEKLDMSVSNVGSAIHRHYHKIQEYIGELYNDIN